MLFVNHLKFVLSIVLTAIILLAISACSEEGKPVKGFVLPEGDIAQGEQVFVDFNCHGCHTIPGVDFPDVDFTPPFILKIGGKVYRVKHYGELLTAVTNPRSHYFAGIYRHAGQSRPRSGDFSNALLW